MRKETCAFFAMGFFCLAVAFPGLVGAAAQDTITLKFSAWTVPKGGFADTCNSYLDRIEKRSNGRVKFERYWSGTLIPAREEVAGIGKGVADIAVVVSAMQKRLSLIDVAALPGLGATLDTQGRILTELAKMKAVKDQFAQHNLVLPAVQGGDPTDLISTTPIASVADLKGKKIRIFGDAAKTLQALGAIPVGLASGETYEALERGIVEGVVSSPAGIFAWKWHECANAKCYTRLALGCYDFYFMMNKDSWESLPSDIQNVFKKVGEEQVDNFIQIYREWYKEIFAAYDKMGMQFFELSAEDKKQIREAARPVWKRWLETQKKKGIPGQEVLDRCLELNGIK